MLNFYIIFTVLKIINHMLLYNLKNKKVYEN